MMLSDTLAWFLVEVPPHGQAAVPAAGEDHCHHPWGREKPSQGAASALLVKTLCLLTLAAGCKFILNLLLRGSLLSKL